VLQNRPTAAVLEVAMQALRSVAKTFARSSLARFIGEAFQTRTDTAAAAPIAARRAQRPDFSLEAIEPRLLLSVNLDATTIGAVDVTLRLVEASPANFKVQLQNGSGTALQSVDIGASENDIKVTRSVAGSAFSDTIRVDFESFDRAGYTPGSLLNITFDFQGQDIFKDKVILEDGSLPFSLNLTSNSDILLPAGTELSSTGDVSLSVVSKSTGFLNNLSTDEEAALFTGVVGDIDYEFDFFADVDANLDVFGQLSADSVNLTASSTIAIDNTGLALGSVHLAFIYANSYAGVDIGTGAHVTATTGDLKVQSTSNARAVASLAALAAADAGEADAALAGVILFSKASSQVHSDAEIDAVGAFGLAADNVAIGGALADGSKANSGASLALTVMDTKTSASISDTASIQAGSVSVSAQTENTLTALAKSSSGGAKDDGKAGTSSASQKALKDNKAGTADGDTSIAGAVAVGTVISSTEAHVDLDATGIVTSTGLLAVSATSATHSQTLADGSSTKSGATGVGVAVAIGVGVLDNHAYVAGSDLNAGALSISALTGDRTIDFAVGDVDATANTVKLANGGHGLRTGDEVIYSNAGAAAGEIGSLDEGTHYFVAVQSDGTIKLYDTKENAWLPAGPPASSTSPPGAIPASIDSPRSPR
jgi:hypothetical protein